MIKATQWKKVPLGSLADFRNGVNYTKENFGKGIKVVNVKDFQDYTKPRYKTLDEIDPEGVVRDRDLLRDQDILFVRSNGNRELIGRSVFLQGVPGKLTHSAFTIRARFVSTRAVPRFYAYLFRSRLIRDNLTAYGGGTNISNLNQKILNELVVPCPPLSDQAKIASILSAYDDLIENNLRHIKILEEMARLIYREWFVKFRFPGHKKVKLVDSPLGKIPEGWEVRSLGEECYLVMGQSPKSEFYNTIGEGLPFHQGVTDFGDRFPRDRIFCTVDNRVANSGDILVSVRAPVGRINLAHTKLIVGRGLCSIRNREGYQWFAFRQLREHFREEDLMGSGTIFKAVTKKDMESIPFLVPDDDYLEMIEQTLEPIEHNINTLSKKNITLRRTRDLLLPRLVSGEVDVSELDIAMETDEVVSV